MRAARFAGKDLSSYVLDAVLPPQRELLESILAELGAATQISFPLAALSDFLAGLSRGEFERVVYPTIDLKLGPKLDPLRANFVASMVEHQAGVLGAKVPDWTAAVEPLTSPYFASTLCSLRVHLLTSSPPAYRRRNLFVDAVVGDRV